MMHLTHKNIDRIISQFPKIRQLFYTEWDEVPARFKDLIFKLYQQQKHILNPENLIINNHLYNHCEITNKKLLYKNMVSYYVGQGVNPH